MCTGKTPVPILVGVSHCATSNRVMSRDNGASKQVLRCVMDTAQCNNSHICYSFYGLFITARSENEESYE